jgi:hypothetical protein
MLKAVLALVALVALTGPGMAQDANGAALAEQQAAMKRFAWMQGVWRGPGNGMNRSGPYQVTQTERIGPFLGGTVIVMEGKGYKPDGTVGFNAFGILSYDPLTKSYTLHSYALGYAGDFALTPTETGYVWEIPAGPGAVIRYTATFVAGIWTEVGDYVAGAQPPRRVFVMTLKRIGDSDWPEAGGVPRD